MITSTVAGLVLAGGKSRRMDRDKAAIPVDGAPQVRRLAGLLAALCDPVLVSVPPGESARPLYRGLRTVEDRVADAGPLCGIVSAHLAYPDAALAVVAVDLFGLSEEVLAALFAVRRETVCDGGGLERAPAAVAFVNEDGGPEPLCAIWEPSLLSAARHAFEAGARSARAIMRQRTFRLVRLPDGPPAHANTLEEFRRFLRQTGRRLIEEPKL